MPGRSATCLARSRVSAAIWNAAGDAKLAKYLEQAHLSCARARDLIQQMLTFSRGQRGEPRPLSLVPCTRESVKLLRSSLPATVEIETDLARDVPPVLLDPVQLDQILMNLCINARDAMGGVGAIRVSVDSVAAHDLVCTSCRQPVSGPFVAMPKKTFKARSSSAKLCNGRFSRGGRRPPSARFDGRSAQSSSHSANVGGRPAAVRSPADASTHASAQARPVR